MKQLFIIICLIPSIVFAHGDEDHSGGKKSESKTTQGYFSSETNTSLYELLLKYPAIKINEEVIFTLYISEYNSNIPIDSATLKITSLEDNNVIFEVHQVENGAYEIKTTFPENKKYSLAININSTIGPDLMVMENIEVGKELESETIIEVHQHSWFKTSGIYLFGGLLIGILIAIVLMRRRKINPRSTFLLIVILSFPISIENVSAHGDEDHSADKNVKSTTFSDAFAVPKETQFLFSVFTEKLILADFNAGTQLAGTIIPSSNGQAVIQSPQTGKISSLQVTVGQKVTKGQTLAVVEQNIDAQSQVDLLSQKNVIETELIAARKEYERLQSIQDIISKKDLEASEARYDLALENKKLFDNLSSNNAGNSKLIYLKSPINGIAGNFNLSIGSAVNAGETLFTVTDLTTVYVEAQLYDKNAAQLVSSKKYTAISSDGERSADVQLITSGQTIDATNQSRIVLFKMVNANADFKIGEFVNVWLSDGNTEKNLAVPNSAISELNGKPILFIKDAAENYSLSYVITGNNNGKHTVIESGAEAGERIVINGSYQMKMIYLNQ